MYEIYSKPNCPNCDQAKRLLSSKGIDYTMKVVDVDFTVEDLYQIAPRSHRSYPMVTVNGKYLGSLSHLKDHLEDSDA